MNDDKAASQLPVVDAASVFAKMMKPDVDPELLCDMKRAICFTASD